MIDWISITLDYSNSVRPFAGEIISTDTDHNIIYRKKKRVLIFGKHESVISISDSNCKLRIDGNFAKFLQGHNIFGTTDLKYLVKKVLEILIELGILKPTKAELEEWFAGHYEIRRVDCNLNWRFQNAEILLGWLRQLPFNSKLHYKPPNLKEGSIYFGQASSHWSIKFYSKYNQITTSKYSLPKDILLRDELLLWSKNILRGELVLRGRKLKYMNLNKGSDWNVDTAKSITYEYLNKIHMSSQSNIKKLEIEGLTPRLLAAFTLYTQQYNLRDFYKKKSTFSKLASDLLALGVDIRSAYSGKEFQVLNLQEFISPKYIAPVPDFAYGTYLFANES